MRLVEGLPININTPQIGTPVTLPSQEDMESDEDQRDPIAKLKVDLKDPKKGHEECERKRQQR